MDPNPWVGAGAGAAITIAALAFILNVARWLSKRQNELEENQKLLEIREQRCERRLSFLIDLIHKAGITIPADFWEL